MPWAEERKAAIAKVLTWDYTSSDESDMSEDENGLTCLKGYIVKKLSWEKTTLHKAKKALDDAYIKSLPPRVRANVLERRIHHTPSKRGPPPDAIQWAVRIITPETPPVTPAVTRPLETPACRAVITPTHTVNPSRTLARTPTSQSPATPRTTPAVTRPLETPAARTVSTPACTSQSPVTPRATPSTIDSTAEQSERHIGNTKNSSPHCSSQNNSNTNTEEEKDCTRTNFQIACVLDLEHFRFCQGNVNTISSMVLRLLPFHW